MAKTQEEMKELQESTKELQESMKELQESTKELQESTKSIAADIADLTQRVDELSRTSHAHDVGSDAYKLSVLFFHYHVLPKLARGSTWLSLSNSLHIKLEELEDEEISQKEFEAWLGQLPESEFLLDLHWMIYRLDGLNFFGISSRLSQTRFLEKAKNYDWETYLPKQAVTLRKIVDRLGSTSLYRITDPRVLYISLPPHTFEKRMRSLRQPGN